MVGAIEIHNGSVFPVDESDPWLLRRGIRLVNFLHIETARSFIRDELLFEEGDCFDPFLLAESQRLLEGYGFIERADLEVEDAGPGVRKVVVRTQDRWSTQVDLGFAYDQGTHLERFQASERNFLGHGITAQVAHRQRREQRERHVRLFTPRFLGRTDADLRVGETRAGSAVFQRFNHGFLGEASRFSASEIFEDRTAFYSYATGGGEHSHILLPMRKQRVELAAAVRLGEPGDSWILGVSLDRSVYRRGGEAEYVRGDDFDGARPEDVALPDPVVRQAGERGATRLAVHVGTRRVRWVEYQGLDAISERQMVALGFFGGVSVGRSLGRLFVPEGVPAAGDTYVRAHTVLTEPVGPGLLGFSASVEGGHAAAAWRDVLAQGDVYGWGRAPWLPGQTLFVRASAGGAWSTTLPFQLSLGGRDGVRSLRDDAMPAGRRFVLTVEDRIRLPWPRWQAVELGATVFADAGRVWAGDAPFAEDSGWMGAVGLGLRVALPAGSRQVVRPEIVFPVGFEGSPVFRITAEMHSIRWGFRTPRWGESRRFPRGPEEF